MFTQYSYSYNDDLVEVPCPDCEEGIVDVERWYRVSGEYVYEPVLVQETCRECDGSGVQMVERDDDEHMEISTQI